jgi:crotonyl-CoA reductase
MQQLRDAIIQGASGDELAALPIPDHYRAAFVRREDTGMFEGIESADKDPRKSLHIGEVPTPPLAPDEVYVAVMASSINFNTVWTSIFEPLPTFAFLDRLGRESEWAARHALDRRVRLQRLLRVGSGAVVGRATGSPSTATTSTIRTHQPATRCWP